MGQAGSGEPLELSSVLSGDERGVDGKEGELDGRARLFLASSHVISLEKNMLASLEGDNVAHRNLRPRMYRWVVLLEPHIFLSRQHQIRITENRRGERKQWPLETTLDFKHCRLDIILSKASQHWELVMKMRCTVGHA